MKKRILSLLVSVILILQSICMITSATPAETDNVPVIPAVTQNAVDFLVKLGVLDADFDATEIPETAAFFRIVITPNQVDGEDVVLSVLNAGKYAGQLEVTYSK